MTTPDSLLVVFTDHDWKMNGAAWDLIRDEEWIQIISPIVSATWSSDIQKQKGDLVVAAGTKVIKNKPSKVVIDSTDPEFGHGLAHQLIDQNDFPSKDIVLVEATIDDYRYRKFARELGLIAVSYKGFLQLLAGVDLDKIKTIS